MRLTKCLACSILLLLNVCNTRVISGFRLHKRTQSDKSSHEEDQEDLRYDVTLDSKGKLHLFWDLDIITETLTFRLEAQIQPQETLAFGFSAYGESEDADLVVYWRDATGKRHFQVRSEQIYACVL